MDGAQMQGNKGAGVGKMELFPSDCKEGGSHPGVYKRIKHGGG